MVDPSFELGLMAAVLREVAPRDAGELIDSLEFQYPSASHIWAICRLAWRSQNGSVDKRLPTLGEIRHAISTHSQGHDPIYQDLALRFLDGVAGASFTGYTRQELATLAARGKVLKLAATMQTAIADGKPLQETLPEWRAALSALDKVESTSTWIELGETARLDLMERRELDRVGSRVFPTWIRRFDQYTMGGGLSPEDLWIILGGTGRGKSTLAVQLAIWMAGGGPDQKGKGHTVLIITLEGSPDRLRQRIEANLTRIRTNEPHDADFRTKFALAYHRQVSAQGGRIIIPEEVLPQPFTVQHVKAAVQKAEDLYACRVDITVIDHLDVMGGDKTAPGKEYLAFKQITEGLQHFAQERGSPIIIPTQGEKFGQHKEVPTMANVSGGFNKTWACTQFASIAQTPAQRKNGDFGLVILKNRQAIDGKIEYIIPLRFNYGFQSVFEGPGDQVMELLDYEKASMG